MWFCVRTYFIVFDFTIAYFSIVKKYSMSVKNHKGLYAVREVSCYK